MSSLQLLRPQGVTGGCAQLPPMCTQVSGAGGLRAISRVGELSSRDVPIHIKEMCAWFSFAPMGFLWDLSGKMKRIESTATPSVASGTLEATAGTSSVVSSGA